MCVDITVEKCFSHDQNIESAFMSCGVETFVLVTSGVHFQNKMGKYQGIGHRGPEYHSRTVSGTAWLKVKAQLQSSTC